MEKVNEKLSVLKVQNFEKIEEGSLFLVTVGNEKITPTFNDMERISKVTNELLGDAKAVKALILPHYIVVKAFSLEELSLLSS
jgi:hypothetical protein